MNKQKIAQLEALLERGYGRTNKPLSSKRRKQIQEQIDKFKEEINGSKIS